MVDNNHEPVQRAYNLMDRRAIKEVEWLIETFGEEKLYQISGYRLEDHPSLVNLLWEKRNRPDSFRRVAKALTIDGFITLKLTGQAVLHYSGASFYGVAYDLRKRRFDEGLLKDLDIPSSILPELARCTDIIGKVTKQAAEQTGLTAGIPVAAGQVDCNASYIGAGAIEEGDF